MNCVVGIDLLNSWKLIVAVISVNGNHFDVFQGILLKKTEWNCGEKEQVLVDGIIQCSIKCLRQFVCGGFLYNNDTGTLKLIWDYKTSTNLKQSWIHDNCLSFSKIHLILK